MHTYLWHSCLYVGVSLPDGTSGGWGAILVVNGKQRGFSGAELATSTDRLGLHAIIAGLRAADQVLPLCIITDNQRLCSGLTDHLHNWQRNNWVTRNGKSIRHHDLWKQVLEYAQSREISSNLRAESGDAIFMIQAKRLATKAAQAIALRAG